MSETNWILNLIDRVTAPMKKVTDSVTGGTKAIADMTEAVRFNESEAREALNNEKTNRQAIKQKIKEQEKAIKELEKTQKETAPGEQWAKGKKAIDSAKKKLEEYKQELKDSEEDIKDINSQLDEAKKKTSSWVDAAIGVNQFSELLSKVAGTLDFTTEINKTKDNLQRLTGLGGSALDNLMGKIHGVGKSFGDSDDEIAKAANSLKQTMGVSYNEAIDLIEKGYEKGANLGGDMLANMQKFGPQMQQMGLSASEMVSVMAQASKNGINVDSVMQSLDEANTSIQERGKAQIAALKGIGLEVNDLSDKSSFEAVQIISKNMEGATTQAKALVLKDIFKSAGKDAGTGWIEGIGTVDMNIDNIPSVVDSASGFKRFLADIEMGFANTFGNAGTYIDTFATGAGKINDVIGMVQTLSKVTWLQNTATKAMAITQGILNAVMNANPIFLIITLILGLIATVIALSNKFEWAAGIVGGVKNSFKDFGQVLLDVILLPLKLILSSVGAIGKAIAALFKRDWGGAWDAAKSAADPIKELFNDTKKAAGSFSEGYKNGVEDLKDKKKAEADKKAAEDAALAESNKPKDVPSLGDIFSTPDAATKKGKQDKEGMSISGAGGSKSITMNLEIKNYFNNVKGNVRQIADEIAGHINDRLRDSLVTQ